MITCTSKTSVLAAGILTSIATEPLVESVSQNKVALRALHPEVNNQGSLCTLLSAQRNECLKTCVHTVIVMHGESDTMQYTFLRLCMAIHPYCTLYYTIPFLR